VAIKKRPKNAIAVANTVITLNWVLTYGMVHDVGSKFALGLRVAATYSIGEKALV